MQRLRQFLCGSRKRLREFVCKLFTDHNWKPIPDGESRKTAFICVSCYRVEVLRDGKWVAESTSSLPTSLGVRGDA